MQLMNPRSQVLKCVDIYTTPIKYKHCKRRKEDSTTRSDPQNSQHLEIMIRLSQALRSSSARSLAPHRYVAARSFSTQPVRASERACVRVHARRLCLALSLICAHRVALFCAEQTKSQNELNESMLGGSNAVYVEQMHENWLKNRASVHASWDAFFANVERNLRPGQAFTLPPSLGATCVVCVCVCACVRVSLRGGALVSSLLNCSVCAVACVLVSVSVLCYY